MKRNRRNNARKERIIMIASSAFVLSALTMTGIYMKSNNAEEQNDGYMIDLTSMEEGLEDKVKEIAQNSQTEKDNEIVDSGLNELLQDIGNLEDDLDYLPMEAGSGLVQIPGLTDGITDDVVTDGEQVESEEELPAVEEAPPAEEASGAQESGTSEQDTDATDTPEPAETEQETAGSVIADTLHFSESEGLLRPVSGEVTIPFSMDGSVYFSTLDQFKYNPAMMISAETGSTVYACAEGRVVDIFEDEEIGHAITMDLGDGYQITYGQLSDINVTWDSHVGTGDVIASVAAPTKYYSVEGSNLYLKLTLDGTPINPEALFY